MARSAAQFRRTNVFFMNSAGAIFGPNAELDIDGELSVTAADTIKLADGGKFAGDTVAANSVLTSAPPSAFGFLKPKASPLVVVGNFDTGHRATLTTHDRQTLSLVGGEIAVAVADITAPGSGHQSRQRRFARRCRRPICDARLPNAGKPKARSTAAASSPSSRIASILDQQA